MIGDFRAFQIGNSKEKEKDRNTYLMQRFVEEKKELTPFDFMEGEIEPYEVEDIDFDEISPYDFM